MRVRVDNGSPWGSAGDLPTELALWLFGLGVEVIWNPPRRPQDNGVIERSQGTGKRWAETATCADAAELQRRIDEMDRIQREVYPCIGGKSRTEAFPELEHSGRHYRAEDEAASWSLPAALAHLATYCVQREVDEGGCISLGNRSRYVGTPLKGKRVCVSLDPYEVAWLVHDAAGVCYHRLEAGELSAERITGLDVSRHRHRPGPRPRRRQRTAAELPANNCGA
ncbi:Integrase core domain protein [Aquisphaera giovannonii]|uniref:Integrase core domain protein n=2 Tax=Aquisphaera giovannonii TaxID=406548 RepID=A0A5B9WGC4_9BACT|nr:Integrase core domain protein [Aquisphaera giovannonii]QEH39065.1 Integrase core domain protein [Aquisphaera giovannonii]